MVSLTPAEGRATELTRPPSLAVMVLNYNGSRWLPACLSSIAATDYPELSVYLVDNGSLDLSVDSTRKDFPWVRIIHYPTNLGFAEAYNRALQNIRTEYVVLLNNDTEVLNPNWLRSLVNVAARDTGIAAVACKMVSMADHSILDSVGGMGIPFWRGFVDMGRGQLDRGQYDSTDFKPFAFCGGAALVKRDTLVSAGGFDRKFFLYNEDIDLSWRLRLLGYRVGFASEAKVAHYFSGSTGVKDVDPAKLYYCHRNLLRAILKNCGSSLMWALRNYFIFSLILAAGFGIVEPKKAVSVAKAILWNLLNLKDTLAKRFCIQAARRAGEREVLVCMYPRLARYQPAEHTTVRRILNVLFEHSQSVPDQLG